MVKGSESVVCSFAWERSVPDVAEVSALQAVKKMFGKQSVDCYIDMLDRHADFLDESAAFAANEPYMSANGLWLVIAAGHRRDILFAKQSQLAVQRAMTVVIGLHDALEGEFSSLEKVAVNNGAVFYWGDRQELFEGIEDVVLPMCDNSTNDCNTKWTSQRKTA